MSSTDEQFTALQLVSSAICHALKEDPKFLAMLNSLRSAENLTRYAPGREDALAKSIKAITGV
ncbi:MAG: hypothetical protein J0I01_05805 [Stenotrophomonas nitritireducens]|nr:hypothetical protein [Stenotrophomonas nitritireducens]MBN8791727.1 hypothetical protein [Stenotrophomonas nitritireducens]MBN8795665.1 hypothetical protein [Stenotrophomonas nitritireducens]MBN8798757.1 hypothetical protein [Stenotrophomonas nitritireducens]